tara:strand:- start:930 stop:1406 length:477 start_codon:yes stop_codon:yes gene_type:complete
MFEKEMNLLYKKRRKWRNVLVHFGCEERLCDDLISDMYLKVFEKMTKGTNIMYNKEEINYYYIYKILRSIYYNKTRKEKDYHFVGLAFLREEEADPDNAELYLKIETELKQMYWYDRKVFEIVASGESILNLSKMTKISYHSLYKTFKKVKKKIKKIL